MLHEKVIQFLEGEGFTLFRTNRVEEVRINCPFCEKKGKTPDRKGHLYVNIQEGLVHCFRCEYGATLKVFLDDLKAGTDFKKHELNYPRYGRLQKLLKENQLLKIDIPFPRIDLYDNPAKDFLVEYIRVTRGLDEEVIWKYDLRAGSGNYKGRIVIPVSEQFTNIYFTARSIFETDTSKYKNPVRGEYGILVGKSEVLYNIDAVPEGVDRVVVQEGPLDVMATHGKPYPCVALLGSSISRQQMFKLLLKHPGEVVVALDSDAVSKAFELGKRLAHYIPTSVLILEKGDPADWKEKYFEVGTLQKIDFAGELTARLEATQWENKPLANMDVW